MTKAELDEFKIGVGIPYCEIEARPLGPCKDYPRITLSGVKPPYNELTLRLPSRRGKFNYQIYYSHAS